MLGSARQCAVLVRLLVQAPEPVSPERLIDELWGERPPATAQHAVHVYISRIRKVLRACSDEATVRSSAAGYMLELDRELIDARRFERLVLEGQTALTDDPSHARGVFTQALALWRGPALAEFMQFEFARREADRVEELRAIAIEGQMEAKLARGEHAEVLGTVIGLVRADPLREGPRRLLMLALYRAGRQAEALSAYRDACVALDEIGLQPGPELRALEGAILRHDANLLAAHAGARARPDDPARSRAMPSFAGTQANAADAFRPVVVGAPPSSARRKVVTALFCCVTASTDAGYELEPEVQRSLMDRLLSELCATLKRHGATVETLIGEEVLAVFGVPSVREDDALRAVRAAAEIRERLAALASTVGVTVDLRAGVNTGLVLAGDGESSATGQAVNIAARLARAEGSEQIVLSHDTWSLVRDAVEVQAITLPTGGSPSIPRTAFRLVSVDPTAPGVARHLDAAMVGRTRELGVLEEVWQRSLNERSFHLCTVVGPAGIGKSRLVAELLIRVEADATVLRGRCLHYGESITFWPLVEALKGAGEQTRPVLERLSGSGAAVAQELFWEVRRLLEALAAERPLILHIDDLQWAQPMLFDLLENVGALAHGAPILLLCTARPELLEERPDWRGGKPNQTALQLEPLDTRQSARLLKQLADGLDDEVRTRVIDASDGNPLFLEEIAALARERGTVAVPATIQALLAARLERLGREERQLLECGAIEGEVFHRLAVCALAGERPAAALESWLAQLVRKDVIRPHPATLPGDEAFRFRHLLLRDAAYDSLPKATRATLHERFAGWLEDACSELPESDDLAGWHLEQASRYQRELARPADIGLARRAAEHLYLASQRADERRDTSACRSLLERALALAPAHESIAGRIRIGLAGTMLEAGELTRVGELLSVTEQEPSVVALARLYRLEWWTHSRPDEATETIDSILPPAVGLLARAGDERGLAKAHLAAWRVHWARGHATAAGEQARLAAIHARAAGDEGLRSHALGNYFSALQHGPRHAAEIARELDGIERDEHGPYLAASINRLRAKVCSLEGRFAEARRLIQLAIDDCQSLGMPIRAVVFSDVLVETEFAAGNPVAALNALQRADQTLAQHGERAFRSTVQAYLARAHEALHDLDAARAAIDLADQLTMPDDAVNFAITDAVRARIALAEHDGDAAECWARSAVDHALQTEFLWDQAETRLNLAHVLIALGQRDHAADEVRAALELYKQKGDRPRQTMARAMLKQLSP